MPSFSSTRSFMRWTCGVHSQSVFWTTLCALASLAAAYLVVGFDVQLDFFAGEGADSGWGGGLVSFLALFGFA